MSSPHSDVTVRRQPPPSISLLTSKASSVACIRRVSEHVTQRQATKSRTKALTVIMTVLRLTTLSLADSFHVSDRVRW
jgi:hypothetical protein